MPALGALFPSQHRLRVPLLLCTFRCRRLPGPSRGPLVQPGYEGNTSFLISLFPNLLAFNFHIVKSFFFSLCSNITGSFCILLSGSQ